MDHDKQLKLEVAIDRELKALPPRKAPAELIPSVLAALRADALRPWWRKSWPLWPRRIQILSLTFGLLCVLTAAGGAGWAWLAWVAKPLAEWGASARQLAGALFSFVDVVVGAAAVLARSAGAEIWIGLGLAAMGAWWVCAGAGCWCYRMARARHSITE